MKKILLLCVCALSATLAFSQAKKPTLMVVPSDLWCNQNGYVQEYDNQGIITIMPDYQAALMNNVDLKLVIAKINDLMAERASR